MNLKLWKKIEEGISITFKDYEELKDFLFKQDLKIKELKKSRDNWRERALKKEVGNGK